MGKDTTEKKITEVREKEVLKVNSTLAPTTFTDFFNLARKDDGSILVRLLSILPDGLAAENHRTMLPPVVARDLIDALADFTGYYPKKKLQKKKTHKKNPKKSIEE